MRGRYFCEGNREEREREAKHFSCAEQRVWSVLTSMCAWFLSQQVKQSNKVGRKLYHKCLNIMCYMKSVLLINWQQFSIFSETKIKNKAQFLLPHLNSQILLHTLQRSREHNTLLLVSQQGCDTNTHAATCTDRETYIDTNTYTCTDNYGLI